MKKGKEKKHSHSQEAHSYLCLVVDGCIHHDLRHSAAVDFQEYVKAHWSPPIGTINPISDSEKEKIKSLIVSAIIKAEIPKIQSQLIKALQVIIEHCDFPKEWPALLPEIVGELKRSNDYALINLLLGFVNSLFMKFRCDVRTSDLLVDLKYCVDNFAKLLLEVFRRTGDLITDYHWRPLSAIVKTSYIKSQRLCCSIFYSLSFQELPECFKDGMSEWMFQFKKCLSLRYYPLRIDRYLLDELYVEVCENISLYVMEEKVLFRGHLSGIVKEVVNLLVSSSSRGNGNEKLTVTGVKLLIMVSKSSHHGLLTSDDDVLQQICRSIVIPNVMLQDDEEKLFETDPMEYIKRDMEGSNIDTRRGIVIELLNGIGMHCQDKLWEKVAQQIHSDRLEDTWDTKSFQIMKQAGALKLITLFSNQISKHIVLLILPNICHLLTSKHVVLHSYAAICIEKLLLIKDDKAETWRYTLYDIRRILPTLMRNLLQVLRGPKSNRNEYVMKCIMRVVCVGDLTADKASMWLEGLITILDDVCQNPIPCIFIHCLFVSLAALIRTVSVISKETRSEIDPIEKKVWLVTQLEKKLYPCLEMILGRDIRELFPYAFWLLAELADMSRPLVSEDCKHIFDVFRLPYTWKRSANFPETAFLNRAPQPMHRLSMIGIYDKLVLSSGTEEYGFNVLDTVVEHLGIEVISPFLREVWISLFNRLQNKRRIKSVENSLVLMSRFLLKFGPRNLANSVNAVLPNGFQAIMEHVWIPNRKLITCPIELKLILDASTRIICECRDILEMKSGGR